MEYYISFKLLSLNAFKDRLKNIYLTPGRMILKEKLDERFKYFGDAGVMNVEQLLSKLKKHEFINDCCSSGIFNENYLTVLQREIRSMHPKPNPLVKLTNIPDETIEKLREKGITDTFKLYPRIRTNHLRKELSASTGISYDEIMILSRYTDLSRIKWVSADFARVLMDAGIDSVEKAAEADAGRLYEEICLLNRDHSYFKGKIGLKDINTFIESAREVPPGIDFNQ